MSCYGRLFTGEPLFCLRELSGQCIRKCSLPDFIKMLCERWNLMHLRNLLTHASLHSPPRLTRAETFRFFLCQMIILVHDYISCYRHDGFSESMNIGEKSSWWLWKVVLVLRITEIHQPLTSHANF